MKVTFHLATLYRARVGSERAEASAGRKAKVLNNIILIQLSATKERVNDRSVRINGGGVSQYQQKNTGIGFRGGDKDGLAVPRLLSTSLVAQLSTW